MLGNGFLGLQQMWEIDNWNVQVFSEPLEVNLFLHVKNTEASTLLNGKSPVLYCCI